MPAEQSEPSEGGATDTPPHLCTGPRAHSASQCVSGRTPTRAERSEHRSPPPSLPWAASVQRKPTRQRPDHDQAHRPTHGRGLPPPINTAHCTARPCPPETLWPTTLSSIPWPPNAAAGERVVHRMAPSPLPPAPPNNTPRCIATIPPNTAAHNPHVVHCTAPLFPDNTTRRTTVSPPQTPWPTTAHHLDLLGENMVDYPSFDSSFRGR
jgi:hypothetical protein